MRHFNGRTLDRARVIGSLFSDFIKCVCEQTDKYGCDGSNTGCECGDDRRDSSDRLVMIVKPVADIQRFPQNL